MEAKVILDTRYSSHVNGTATSASDDDTVFVFLSPDHAKEEPFSQNTDPEINPTPERRGVPLWRFMRGCLLGDPLCIDLLFLPRHAYISPPPEILMDHRSIFVTKQAVTRYLAFAEYKRMQAARYPARAIKTRYHSLIYLNSARSLLQKSRPAFFDPGYLETLSRVRNDTTLFDGEFNRLRTEINTLPNPLPFVADSKLLRILYDDIVASVSTVVSQDVLECGGGCGGGKKAEAPPSSPHPSERGGVHWWKLTGPLLWEELHRWALSQYASDPRAWLDAFATRIPCGDCKQHWLDWAAANPPPAEMAEMFAWTVKGHNAVNERLKKDEITMAQAIERWAA